MSEPQDSKPDAESIDNNLIYPVSQDAKKDKSSTPGRDDDNDVVSIYSNWMSQNIFLYKMFSLCTWKHL